MIETFFLSSMDSATFSSVHRCEVVERVELPNGHHALLVTCDPPVPGQDLGHPLGIDRLLLWSRFEGDDLWKFPTFPHFVQVCLPDVPLHPTRMPASIAWGEVYASAEDASTHAMDGRPHTPSDRDGVLRFTMPVDTADPFSLDAAAIVSSLALPPCVWLVTDLEMTARPGADVDVAIWDRRIRTAAAPGAALSDAEFRSLLGAADQVVDGEAIGFASLDDLLAFRAPVVRIDAFDTTEWIVVLDPRRVGVGHTFRAHFGDGVPGPLLRPRAQEFPARGSVTSARRDLALAGETLDLVEVDPTGATTMRFSNDALVRFERDFAVGTHDNTESFVLRSDLATVLPALRLLHDEVAHATVSAARLDVTFRSGASLSGWADRSAASWRFRNPGRPAVEVDVLAGGTVDVREHRPPAGDPLPWGRPTRDADEFVWGADGRSEEHDVEVPGTGVRLRLVGTVVERCTFGHAATLSCSNGSTLVFETPLTVSVDGTASTVDPGSPGTLAPLLTLHGRRITSARVADDRLVLALADGVTVEAPTDPHHESWHYAGPDPTGLVVLGMPGGGLAWW